VHVAFVKPVAQPRPEGGPDRSTALVTATTALHPPDPLSSADVEHQLGTGGLDAVLEQIVAVWQPVYERSDVVVVEGLSPRPNKMYVSELNQALAAALDAEVVLIGSWPANPTGGQDRADGVADPARDPMAGTLDGLARTRGWSAVWSTACRRRSRLRRYSLARR
jgi:BioD-like phosphotransacetylase family protein